MGIRIRSIAGALALLSFSAVSGTRADPPHYVLTPLPWIGQIPGGLPGSAAGAISNLGQVVGSTTTQTGPHVFLYSNGGMQDLGALDGPDGAGATGINDAGQIVGVASTATSSGFDTFLATTSGGSMRDLGLTIPPGATMAGIHTVSINAAGVIAGINGNAPVVYDAGTIHTLPTPGYPYGAASGINDSNEVVGYLWSDSSSQPFEYDLASGTLRVLAHSSLDAVASGINNVGHVIGWWTGRGTGYRGMMYENGAWSDLLPAQSTTTFRPEAINSVDAIVGLALDAAGGYSALYLGGTLYNLDNLVVNPLPGWTLDDVTGINDQGQIVGRLYNVENGDVQGALLTPTAEPEPGALGLLAVIASVLLLARRTGATTRAATRWTFG